MHPLINHAYLAQLRSELDHVTREGWRHPEPPRPPRLARTRRWLATSLVPREPAEPRPAGVHRAAVTLRPARSGDARDVAFLAAVNGCSVPEEPVLVAEVDGTVRAAAPLAGDAILREPLATPDAVVEILAAWRASKRRPVRAA